MVLPTITSLRERTNEFGSIVERLKKQQGLAGGPSGNGAGPSSSGTDARSAAEHNSGFARKAAEIGHGVHRTSLKLSKLAQLAKRTSMFDDPTSEVEELTGVIKQDITALNGQIAELQRMNARSKDGNKQSESHSHTVVDNLRSRLKDATQEFKVGPRLRREGGPCVARMHAMRSPMRMGHGYPA
jgi:syntaxin 5